MAVRFTSAPQRGVHLALFGLATLIGPGRLGAQDSAFTPRTTVGGYGEVHYTNASGPDTPGEVNVKRFVVFLAHAFSSRLTFRSELELEDARIEGGEGGGEVALEMAQLDYRLSDAVTVRSGLLLIPVGFLNEIHEPPTFNGVARPAFDHDVIPTTWREIGLGLVGAVPGTQGLGYRVYLINGLRAEGFSGAEGIRAGRQEGKHATFANPSLTGRLEWVRPGLRIGGSFWFGGTSAQDSVLGTGTVDSPLGVLAADVRWDRGPFAMRGEVARVTVSDAREINARFGGDVGSRIEGGYLEGAVNVLHYLVPATTQKLTAFVRHERYDTHAEVASGTADNDAYARRITTVGLTYKPVWNVAFKGDYQLLRNKAHAAEGELLSLGIGYQF